MSFDIDIGFTSDTGKKPTNEDFAAAMLPDLLGRYGLSAYGRELETDDERASDLPLAVRSLVSRAARTAAWPRAEAGAVASRCTSFSCDP